MLPWKVGILTIAKEIKNGNRKITNVFFNDFEQRKSEESFGRELGVIHSSAGRVYSPDYRKRRFGRFLASYARNGAWKNSSQHRKRLAAQAIQQVPGYRQG